MNREKCNQKKKQKYKYQQVDNNIENTYFSKIVLSGY